MKDLDFDNPPGEPLAPLKLWIADAEARSGAKNPGAMSLATIDPDGRPSVRVVLLRGLDENGAVFFTNRHSRKGDALRVHPLAAVVFHWDTLERQIRIEGEISQTTDEESDTYWETRPRESRIAAWASDQSRPISNRVLLDEAYTRFETKFTGEDVPRPEFWGGYRVSLERVEFWEGKSARMHDRIEYVRHGDGWKVERLAP